MHTQEPWNVDGSGIRIRAGGRGQRVLICHVSEQFMDRTQRLANARRIAACVNYLQGIPTEELEEALNQRGEKHE